MPTIFPTPLRPGDKIALVAPASVPNRDTIGRFVQEWRSRGYKLDVSERIYDRCGYLAGTDEIRAEELMRVFTDSTIAAVFAARGGYGVNRLIDKLDYEAIGQNPKIFAGFSDMTTLHAALGRKCNLVTFHAPHPNDGLDPKRDRKKAVASFVKSVTAPLNDQCIGEALKRHGDSKGGIATGHLIGGNLAVLASTIGTEYAPNFSGAILFLEETDEKPYRVDRFLSQLRLTGDLDRLAGVILGHFTDCETDDPEHSLTLQQVLGDYFGPLNVPIVTGMNCGHAVPNLTLPMNATVVLDTNSGKLTVQTKPS